MFGARALVFLTRACVFAIAGLFGVSIFKETYSAFDVGKSIALSEFNEATTGKANGKCNGVLTASQQKDCDRYDDTLSKYFITLMWKHFLATIPSCFIMPCTDVLVYLRDSWTAVIIWMAVMIALIVVLTKLVFVVINACSRSLNSDRVDAEHHFQHQLHDRLPPSVRHMLDTAAVQYNYTSNGPWVTSMDDMAPPTLLRQRLPPPPPPRITAPLSMADDLV